MTCEYVVERAAANLPQSTVYDLFTVSGGRVLLVGLFGEVTTAIQAVGQTATVAVGGVTLWSGNPSGLPTGRLLGGANEATALVLTSLSPNGGPYVLNSGANITLDCPQSATGQVRWTAVFRPLTVGATLVAA